MWSLGSTAKLDRPLLPSAAVGLLTGGDLEPMFPIKGVREPLVVYTATPMNGMKIRAGAPLQWPSSAGRCDRSPRPSPSAIET